ncbi:MAG: MFS transporter [Chloroflexi bacterium]|nr:MFS transporter [Chloroflexota bacterium]
MADDGIAYTGRISVFAAVQNPRFRPLWLASVTSSVAYMTVLTARGWVAFDLNRQSGTVGLVVFASFLPSLIITPFAGVLADRYDRRTMLLAMQVVGLVSSLGLAWFAWAGLSNPWPLVVISFINGASRSSATPIEQALLGNLVPRRDLLGAVSLLQANTNGSRLVGPLLAAPLLYVGGGSGAFLIAAALYLVAMWQTWSVGAVPREHRSEGQNPLAQFAAGARYALFAAVVSSLVAIIVLHCAFSMTYDAALPRLAADALGATGKEYSLLVMAIGAGSVTGALTLAGIARNAHRGQLLFVTGILSGLTLVPLAFATSWPGALLAAMSVGLTQSMFIALTTTTLQMVTPDHVRGRVLAVYWGLSGGVMGLGNLAVGGLVDSVGVAPALAVPGLVFAVLTIVTLCAPSLRALYGRRTVTAAIPAA